MPQVVVNPQQQLLFGATDMIRLSRLASAMIARSQSWLYRMPVAACARSESWHIFKRS